MAITGLGIELAIFLFTAFVAYYVSVRLGLTVIVAEIILGVILGPSVLGIVSYGESVRILGELGAIFLLFVVGFEINFKDIYTLKNSVIAVFGVAVPFASGYLLAVLFGYSIVQGMFIGTALTATSIAITAYVLKELNYLNTPVAKAIIGAAVVDDVLALLALSITVSFSAGSFSLSALFLKIVIAVLFVGGTVAVSPFIKKILNWADKWGKNTGHPKVILIFAVAFAFAYSALAEIIGLSAIVGAFLAGVTMHGLVIKEAKEGAEYLEMVFAAIFFVSIGILVDFNKISFNTFFFVLMFVAILSKVIGCMIPALVFGFKPKNALLVGVGMLPRGEIALVVGLIGLTNGIIDQTLYGAILAMTIITTILAPFALSFILKRYPKL